ncbi:probable serine incorporator, partial [Papaver somniferum]|uniref:probable serine incorporator n=1 Tax=Papaver somniferum TaxID=3469 RepID=UPI000E6FB5D5
RTVKVVVWDLLLVLMFFVPDNIISLYGTLSNFGSGLFLLVPVIILLDATNTWNDVWVERGERKWYGKHFHLCIPLLAVFVCYITTLTISGLMFAWFNPSGHDCNLNVFFIVMTIILAFGFVIITLQANASLLPSSVISVYCSYVLYSALSSESRYYVCNGLNNSSNGVTTRKLILGMLTTVISVLYCACRDGSSLKSGDRNPFVNFEQRKDREPDAVLFGYSYTFFHLIFAFASVHSNMLITVSANTRAYQLIPDHIDADRHVLLIESSFPYKTLISETLSSPSSLTFDHSSIVPLPVSSIISNVVSIPSTNTIVTMNDHSMTTRGKGGIYKSKSYFATKHPLPVAFLSTITTCITADNKLVVWKVASVNEYTALQNMELGL